MNFTFSTWIDIVIEKRHLLLFMLKFNIHQTIVDVIQHIRLLQKDKQFHHHLEITHILLDRRLPILHPLCGLIQEIIE